LFLEKLPPKKQQAVFVVSFEDFREEHASSAVLCFVFLRQEGNPDPTENTEPGLDLLTG